MIVLLYLGCILRVQLPEIRNRFFVSLFTAPLQFRLLFSTGHLIAQKMTHLTPAPSESLGEYPCIYELVQPGSMPLGARIAGLATVSTGERLSPALRPAHRKPFHSYFNDEGSGTRCCDEGDTVLHKDNGIFY